MAKGWKKWTTKELETLRVMSEEGKTIKEIADALDRTVNAVRQQRSARSLTVNKNWSKKEELALERMVTEGMTVRHISFVLKRSINSVKEKKHRMGLRLSKKQIKRLNDESRITFTKKKYKEMREDYENRGPDRMTCVEIGKKFNLSDQVLRKIARERGWTRKQASPRKPPIDFSELYRLYYGECVSINALKKHFRCSDRRIYYSLDVHGLAVLPVEERLKIREEFGFREGVPKTKRLSKERSA